jgi:hypothetical protein
MIRLFLVSFAALYCSNQSANTCTALHKKVRLLRKNLRAAEMALDAIEEELDNF